MANKKPLDIDSFQNKSLTFAINCETCSNIKAECKSLVACQAFAGKEVKQTAVLHVVSHLDNRFLRVISEYDIGLFSKIVKAFMEI